MKDMVSNDYKKVQTLSVELLKIFVKICEENNLTYYFTGGALIGVLRHKGFIPWDDDIDVGMPRKDYEKFLEIVNNNPLQGYKISNRFTDENWYFCMSQFLDEETEIEIDLAAEKRKSYLWIDIFPLDGLPTNKVHRWVRVKHILYLRYLVQLLHVSIQVDTHRKRPWYERAILNTFKIIPLNKILDTANLLNKLETVLKKSDFYISEYSGNMLGRYREKEVVRTEYFGKPVKAEFEKILINIPEKSHELQTALYGDYMKLPPIENRVAHNVRIIKTRK